MRFFFFLLEAGWPPGAVGGGCPGGKPLFPHFGEGLRAHRRERGSGSRRTRTRAAGVRLRAPRRRQPPRPGPAPPLPAGGRPHARPRVSRPALPTPGPQSRPAAPRAWARPALSQTPGRDGTCGLPCGKSVGRSRRRRLTQVDADCREGTEGVGAADTGHWPAGPTAGGERRYLRAPAGTREPTSASAPAPASGGCALRAPLRTAGPHRPPLARGQPDQSGRGAESGRGCLLPLRLRPRPPARSGRSARGLPKLPGLLRTLGPSRGRTFWLLSSETL